MTTTDKEKLQLSCGIFENPEFIVVGKLGSIRKLYQLNEYASPIQHEVVYQKIGVAKKVAVPSDEDEPIEPGYKWLSTTGEFTLIAIGEDIDGKGNPRCFVKTPGGYTTSMFKQIPRRKKQSTQTVLKLIKE